MRSPLCPNCQEHMSSVEHGLGGVWSCVYCEGTWLPRAQAVGLAAHLKPRNSGVAEAVATTSSLVLLCPTCQAKSFKAGPAEIHGIYRCATCGSLFFERGVLSALAPQVFSGSAEAPVLAALAGAIGSAVLCDPMPLVFAGHAKKSSDAAP